MNSKNIFMFALIGSASMLSSAFAGDLALKEVETEIEGVTMTSYSLTGKVLYTFESDEAGVSSSCRGACAEIWPPILLTYDEAASVNSSGELEVYALDGSESDKHGFSTINRGTNSSPKYQLTYNGWPLYYYAYDRDEEDAYGDERNPNGVHDWYAFTTDFEGHD